jgi:hypothetical protein
MIAPPKILAAAAVRPRRTLVRMGFIGIGMISVLSSQFSVKMHAGRLPDAPFREINRANKG